MHCRLPLRRLLFAFFLSALFLAELQSDFRVDVTAVFTGCVRQLGLAALAADRIVYTLEPMMAAPGACSALAGLLLRQHYLTTPHLQLNVKNNLNNLPMLLCQVKFGAIIS